MELVQYSTLTCAPCRSAREYITRNYDIDLLGYTYIPLEHINQYPEKYKEIANSLKIRGVPLFVVLEDDKVIYTFRGFDKEQIDMYAAYVVRSLGNKIKDCLPEELENKIKSIFDSTVNDLDNLLESGNNIKNGHYPNYGDELNEDYLNDHDNDIEDDDIDFDFDDNE